MTAPILVFGATGSVGGQVVERLVDAGARVRALVRRPDLVLLWTAPPATAAAVVARLAARVPRIVLLSSPHQTPHPFFQQRNPLARFHAELDALVMGAGVEWTILRPGMFASNTIGWWAEAIRQGDVVRWP